MARVRSSSWSAMHQFGPWTLAALIWRAGVRCTWCGVEVERGEHAIDHLLPRSAGGGGHAPDNVVLACKRCNQLRGECQGVPASLAERLVGAGRTVQAALEEAQRQIAIPVGRGTAANKAARPLALRWFSKWIERDRGHGRAYRLRGAARQSEGAPF